MILKLYEQLKSIADNDYQDIVETSEIIFSYSNRARKLRLWLVNSSFVDILCSSKGNYSFHWERTNLKSRYRHDNAPHKRWNFVNTFPKHCHDEYKDGVTASHIPDKPTETTIFFLNIVRKKIITEELPEKKR